MAKNNNLNDFLTDIANAIRTKKGTSDPINAQDFASEISTITGGGSTNSKWTGHADAEGLRAIGWTDEDIAYYQANGVNWNEEDDQYHLVSDDNKALYGVLTVSNISSYKDRIVYLPKIDTSGVKNMTLMFNSCYSLVSIPMLDTSNVTNMYQMFNYCYSLTSIPMLDTSNVTNMNWMFYNCYTLTSIPALDTSSVKNMSYMFYQCYALTSIPQLDTSNVTDMSGMFSGCSSLTTIPMLDTSSVTNMSGMFGSCKSLTSIPALDTSSVTNIDKAIRNCSKLVAIPILDIGKASYSYFMDNELSLVYAYLKNVHINLKISKSPLISKESLLYIINNEAAANAITITLASYAYDRWAEDADIVAALANHPNISLAK